MRRVLRKRRVFDFVPSYLNPLMPRLLVHTNFGDGLRLKRQYLRNHTSDHHDKHIDTKLYPLRVQS